MKKIIKNHIKANDGAGYIWFLSVLIVVLLMFTAIYNILDVTIAAKNMRTEIDAAAENVFSDIRKSAYDALIKGSTEYSFSSYSNADIADMYADKLGAAIEYEGVDRVIKKTSSEGKTLYTISNLTYTYIDLSTDTSTYYVYSVGDIDHDNDIDNDDLTLANEIYTTNVVPVGTVWRDLDIDQNGLVEARDLTLLESIVEYFEAYNQPSHYSTSVSMLIIAFDLVNPIKFASFEFDPAPAKTYSFVTTMSVKPA